MHSLAESLLVAGVYTAHLLAFDTWDIIVYSLARALDILHGTDYVDSQVAERFKG